MDEKNKNNTSDTLTELGSLSYEIFGSAPSNTRWEHALFRSATIFSALLFPYFVTANPNYMRSLPGFLQMIVTASGIALLILDFWYFHKNKKELTSGFLKELEDIKATNILYFRAVKADIRFSRILRNVIDLTTAFVCGLLIAHFYLGIF